MVVAGPLPTGHVTQRMRISQWPFSCRYITGLNIITAVKQKILNLDTSYVSHWQILANLNRNMQNFPQSGRGLGHVTPKIFDIQSNISPKLLELETSNLVHSFVLENPSGCVNNFHQKGRCLGHVTPKIHGIRLNMSSKLLELETSNLVHSFSWGKPSGSSNNFPKRGVAQVT